MSKKSSEMKGYLVKQKYGKMYLGKKIFSQLLLFSLI